MRAISRLTLLFVLVGAWTLGVLANPVNAAAGAAGNVALKSWEMYWIDPDDPASREWPSPSAAWTKVDLDEPITKTRHGSQGMWIRFSLPDLTRWERPGLLVERLYGHRLSVYNEGRLLYHYERDYAYDRNKLLLPLNTAEFGTEIYIRIETLSERVGLTSAIQIGDYSALNARYVTRELPNLLMGISMIFFALIMLVCSGYLPRRYFGFWVSLGLFVLATGVLMTAHTPLLYLYFHNYGSVLLIFFDLALFALFPALGYYANQVLGRQYPLFNRFLSFVTGYSVFCYILMALNLLTRDRFFGVYYFFTVIVLGVLALTLLLSIIGLSIRHAVKGHRDAVIFSSGMGLLALSGIVDLALFYMHSMRYELVLWKFGLVAFILSLVIVLARRISYDHAKLIAYSKELELFNHKLQRTEKMKIISDLAASVAHEVRNPLQVTRGFLQLLGERTDEQHQRYLHMAVDELDRAAGIITDFLTFAKPELDEMRLLSLAEEMKQIEGMLAPLATMEGGALNINVPEHLSFYGNATKFKQALINMIKNSIEAFRTDGVIDIWAYEDQGKVTIHIRDNGEGMTEEQLARLGEPYFSTKTKGTGLGLMVTFRIIELMQGIIEVHSRKGEGTEMIVRFPVAREEAKDLPDRVRA
ncbi:ATP-binding protein [Paenibacillus sp. IB182496]|uniref:histidine kinase n=1 Tax=Paenibacillus sabuli TaxID=2772509 RepID=A0A927GR09_9BACL|nr:sensor histidine kinase [Paenibacillus sabuli]MBD2844938.1 ATP-binding protein [Paenibacillus sabuli]